MLKRNLLANYLGQVWTALMGFVFVPLYIRLLGVEAYGVIGIFGVLTTCLALLDGGKKPALGREMARFSVGCLDIKATWDLLRTIEIISILIGLLIGGAALASANWVASFWVRADKLSSLVIAEAVFYMGLIAALRFVEGVYLSCMSGLQRHVLMNLASAILATVRSVGALVVLLWVESSLRAFFSWQLAVSVLTVLIYRWISYKGIPVSPIRPRFSWYSLRNCWRFAGGMWMISFLALLLTQVDKVLLSTLIPLEDYGRYTLASVAAAAIFTLISPISATFLPRLTQIHASGDVRQFSAVFHEGAQLVTALGGGVAVTAIFHAETLLRIWLRDDELARQTSMLFFLLLTGNFLNGLCHMPYQAQLAYGITRLILIINAWAVAVLIPMIFWVVPIYGVIGAAAIWAALNFIYLAVFAVFVFRVQMQSERTFWIFGDVLKPLLPCFVVAILGRWLLPNNLDLFITLLALAVLTALACLGAALTSRGLRKMVLQRLI